MEYIIIVGIENPIYAQIFKCERSGQNLIFNNSEEAQRKADSLGCKSRVVVV